MKKILSDLNLNGNSIYNVGLVDGTASKVSHPLTIIGASGTWVYDGSSNKNVTKELLLGNCVTSMKLSNGANLQVTNNSVTIPVTQGTQGLQGRIGIQGPTGARGITGANGTQGIVGSQGIKGSQGITGSQGIQGLYVTGAQGPTGARGITGANGLQGITGAKGIQGTQGLQGLQGLKGPLGIGAQGATGAQGLKGTNGVQGATGAQGLKGSQGITGAQGSAGTVVVGPQGVTGAKGLTGITGARGITGAQGITGSSGVGLRGATGARGITGVRGLQGMTGAKGTYPYTATPMNVPNTIVLRNGDGGSYFDKLYASNGFFESSDIRLKNIISDITVDGTLDKLNKLRKIYYTLKSDPSNTVQLGLIAQELTEYYPELITKSDDGYLNISYDRLSVIILVAIDELINKLNIKL